MGLEVQFSSFPSLGPLFLGRYDFLEKILPRRFVSALTRMSEITYENIEVGWPKYQRSFPSAKSLT
jgi:hypothetical protein